MARLWQSGAEWESTIELNSANLMNTSRSQSIGLGLSSFYWNSVGGSPTCSTHTFVGANSTTYIKKDIYIDSLEAISGSFEPANDPYYAPIAVNTGSGVAARVYIYNDSGTIKCIVGYNDDATFSSAVNLGVSTDTWFRLETKIDSSPANGSETFEVRVDGDTIINDTSLTFSGKTATSITATAPAFSSTVYFDNWAVNSSSGSFNNSWVGEEYIILSKPNAAGDSSPSYGTWADIASSSTSSGHIRIDSTSVYGWFNIQNFGGTFNNAQQEIKAVSVPALVRESSAGNSSYNIGIKSKSGGREYYANKLYYPDLSYPAIGGMDAGDTTPRFSPNGTGATMLLVSETDPETDLPWKITGTTSLTNAQIGVRKPGGTPNIWVYGMAAMIAYTPKPPADGNGMMMMF